MRRLINDNQIIDLTMSANNMIGLELLNNRPFTGFLSETDQFSTDELYRFLMNTYNI